MELSIRLQKMAEDLGSNTYKDPARGAVAKTCFIQGAKQQWLEDKEFVEDAKKWGAFKDTPIDQLLTRQREMLIEDALSAYCEHCACYHDEERSLPGCSSNNCERIRRFRQSLEG